MKSESNSKTTSTLFLLTVIVFLVNDPASGFPEQGKWDRVMNDTEPYWGVHKTLFAGSTITVKIRCTSYGSLSDDKTVKINWLVRKTPCYEEYSSLDIQDYEQRRLSWRLYIENPETHPVELKYKTPFYANLSQEAVCDSRIKLDTYKIPNDTSNAESPKQPSLDTVVQKQFVAPSAKKVIENEVKEFTSSVNKVPTEPILTVHEDGVYLLIIHIESRDVVKYSADVHVEIQSESGYISAVDWPLLYFYEIMCGVYFVMSFIWIILCAMHWRDLLRIQLWISAVAFLGMIEMAVFYAEYESVNSTGVSVTGAVLLAEIISCGKRTLARLLVVIVSIGFGIVKPRLGSTLHRLFAVGVLYFMLASIESSLRILHPVNGPSSRALMASIALSVLDAGICWWIFHSLLNTTRTLRLRRNLVKLGLYRNFTNALLLSCITSVGFMIWSIRYLKTAQCLQDWKDIWIDEAYWHVLFSIILFFIMILWRPTNNNQRYSFSPLIDNATDDEDEDLVVNESFGNMKLRQKKSPSEKMMKSRNVNLDDELRQVYETIPTDLAEGDLPALDSDEELMSSKFELSKMQ